MTFTITTWPAHTTEPIPVPLPNLGRCADCAGDVRLRGDGRLYVHGCTGDGQLPLLVLEPTFVRWLWMQSKRRDDYTNRLTLLAGRHFRGCTRSPHLTAADMDWVTAAELHDRLHIVQFRLTGSDVLRLHSGERCDQSCEAVAEAGRYYDRLLAAREDAA